MKRPAPGPPGIQTNVLIRPADQGDAGEIAALLRESFLEYESQYTAAGFAATTPARNEVIDRINEGPVWLAVLHNQIVGTVSAVASGVDLYIRGMAVRPSIQGLGIGLQLLEQVERFAVGNSFMRLRLSTTPFLDRAIRLYESFGFEAVPDGPHDLFGTPLFTMIRVLDSGSQY